MHTDLTRLGNYLTPNPKKLQAKGKESVRARVANLNEVSSAINHDLLVGPMIKAFEDFYGGKAEIESLTMKSLQQIPELKSQYDQLSSWEWLYGNTLEFNHKMDDYLSLDFFDIHKDLKFYTDCLYPSMIDELTEALLNKSYKGETVRAEMSAVIAAHPDLNAGLSELRDWICKNIEI